MPDIINPGSHVHRPVKEGASYVCQDCRQIIFGIVETDDSTVENSGLSVRPVAATDLAVNAQPVELWLEAIKSRMPLPIDFVIIKMHGRLDTSLGYVEEIMEHDWPGLPGPPHTTNDSATDWWVSE